MQRSMHVRNLHCTLGRNHVLRGCSLEVAPGESMIVLGRSGQGKSVLLQCMLGLLPYQKGSVQMGDYMVGQESEKQQLDRFSQCGVVFQAGALFDSLTVEENIMFHSPMVGQERTQHAIAMMEHVELPSSILKKYMHEISGGMKRRVAIARAIRHNPHYLFFDEPTAGLDPMLTYTISILMRNVITRLGATSIMITHQVESALLVGDRMAVLQDGEIAWTGDAAALQENENPIIRGFMHPEQQVP